MIRLYFTEFPCGLRNLAFTGWGKEGLLVQPGEVFTLDPRNVTDELQIKMRKLKTPYRVWLKRVRGR